MTKTIPTTIGILIILLVAGVAGASVLFFSQEDKDVVLLEEGFYETDEVAKEDDVELQKEDEFADWNTYKNEKYGFEFKYPDLKNWRIVEDSQEEKLLKMDIFNLKTENYDFNIDLSAWDLSTFDKELFELHNPDKGQYKYDYEKGTFRAIFPGAETEIDSIDAIADIAHMPLIKTKDNLRVLTFQNVSRGFLRIDYWIFNMTKDMVISFNFIFRDEDVLTRLEPLGEEVIEEQEIITNELKETINQIISTFIFH